MRTVPILFALLLPVCSQNAATSPHRLPAGFKALGPAGSAGQALVAQFPGDRGRTVLSRALDALGTYFDRRPGIIRAVESVDGKGAQALFTASLGGQPVRGFASADGGRVSVLFDKADRFGQSLPALARQAAGPATAARQVPVHRVQFGTGSMDLPEGWRITSTRGDVVMAEGPQGAVDFSLAMQVYTRQAAAGYPMRPPVVADYGDPARAVQEILGQAGLMRSVRILERAPSPGWDGAAEYLHFRADYQGVPSEIFALVLEKPLGPGSWFFYYSQVRTRAGEFEKNFPVLLGIWKSWKTDDRVFQRRLTDAVNSMKECGRIAQDVNAGRQAAMDRSMQAWDHHIRDTWPVEDTHTGKRVDAPLDINPTIQRLNEIEGYERWRAVPYQELNR